MDGFVQHEDYQSKVNIDCFNWMFYRPSTDDESSDGAHYVKISGYILSDQTLHLGVTAIGGRPSTSHRDQRAVDALRNRHEMSARRELRIAALESERASIEKSLAAERAARLAAEQRLNEVEFVARDLQTRLAHAILTQDEAKQSAAKATQAREAALKELAAEREAHLLAGQRLVEIEEAALDQQDRLEAAALAREEAVHSAQAAERARIGAEAALADEQKVRKRLETQLAGLTARTAKPDASSSASKRGRPVAGVVRETPPRRRTASAPSAQKKTGKTIKREAASVAAGRGTTAKAAGAKAAAQAPGQKSVAKVIQKVEVKAARQKASSAAPKKPAKKTTKRVQSTVEKPVKFWLKSKETLKRHAKARG